MTLEQAKEVLKIEADGILNLAGRIDDNFTRLVDMIYHCRGRVLIAGIGKSGIIARKIVATLNSTGTRAIFLHPVEAMHGDLGMVSGGDVFIALSNSGETDELNILLPSIRSAGCPVVAMTGHLHSTLARQSDLVIDVGVEAEACPLNMAPTASTTAQLAMGDALAVVLINRRKFTANDFQKFHPGGTLGKRLTLRAADIMLTGDSIPRVPEGTDLRTALSVLDEKRLGVVLVTDESFRLTGIITDGDVRRMVVRGAAIAGCNAEELMVREPKAALESTQLYDALNVMEVNQITVLPVLEKDGRVAGILHLHDILGKGAVKFNGA
ncbi:MAG: KpsF/GutQ family sugar-phosphate isomerase [Desulfosalsimonadaceae bacterium]